MQKTYLDRPAGLTAGMLADIAPHAIQSFKNTTGATVPFGVLVALGAADDRLKRLAAATDVPLGIVVHQHGDNNASSTYPSTAVAFGDTDTNLAGVPDKAMASVISSGFVWVYVEQAVAVGDPVYARITTAGAEVNGQFRKSRDSTDCVRLKGAKFATSTSGAGLALLELAGDLDFDTRPLLISLTPGAEDTNAIDVVGVVTGPDGEALTAAVDVCIHSLAVTADKGDLAAATAAVGTLKKAVNPATGENVAWFRTSATGAFSFKVSNDVAEDTLVTVIAEGAVPRAITLTFA